MSCQKDSNSPSTSGSADAALFKLPPDPSSTRSLLSYQQLRRLRTTTASSVAITKPSPEELLFGGDGTSPLDDALTLTTLQALLPSNIPSPSSLGKHQRLKTTRGDRIRALHVIKHALQLDTQRFNGNFSQRRDDVPVLDFLALAGKKGGALYDKAATQLIDYLAKHDKTAAVLLSDIWRGVTALHTSITSQLVKECLATYTTAQDALAEVQAIRELYNLNDEDSCDPGDDDSKSDVTSCSSRAGDVSDDDGKGGPKSTTSSKASASGKKNMLRKMSMALLPEMPGVGGGGGGGKRGMLGPSGAAYDQLAQLQGQNTKLHAALQVADDEIQHLRKSLAALQGDSAELALAEARALAAEAALEEREKMEGNLTPRPSRSVDPGLVSMLGGKKEAAAMVMEALQKCKDVDVEALAGWLVEKAPVVQPTPAAASPQPPILIATDQLSAATTALGKEASPGQSTSGTTPSSTLPTAAAIPTGTAATDTQPSPPLEPLKPWQLSTVACRGCLPGMDPATVVKAISLIKLPTAAAYTRLETEYIAVCAQRDTLLADVQSRHAAAAAAESARRRREEEAALEKKNPIQEYIELLNSQGEEAWKDAMIGMGMGPDVPKLFRYAGKIRNKHMTKRDTEKLLKELWKERVADPAVAAGKAPDMVDFLGSQLQKRVGIAAAVLELGYNFLYGLWQYKYDADCELFLKVLTGETPEDVYIAQVRLQEELTDLFATMDRSRSSAPTGVLTKEEIRAALHSFFRVGHPGGKTLQRFDEAMQALDQDQPGDALEWKKVFEEDREYNQGEFAEAIRDQYLQERTELFKSLETAIYEQTNQTEDAKRSHVMAALLVANPLLSDKEVKKTVAGVFPPGVMELGVKSIMKKLARGAGRGLVAVAERPSIFQDGASASSTRASISGAMKKMSVDVKKMSVSAGPGRAGGKAGPGQQPGSPLSKPAAPKMTENIARALEAVRQQWLKTELADKGPGNGEREHPNPANG